MALADGKKMIPIYVDESIYRTIKVYAAQTDQTMQDVIKTAQETFVQAVIKLVSDINLLNRKSEEERQRLEEEAQLVAENPIQVTGIPVDPLAAI